MMRILKILIIYLDKVDDEDFQDDREIWEVTYVCA